MKIVLVEWNDASSMSSWTSRDIHAHIDPCVSIGVLVGEDDKEIEIVPNLTADLQLHQIAIPKSTIKRIRRLKL